LAFYGSGSNFRASSFLHYCYGIPFIASNRGLNPANVGGSNAQQGGADKKRDARQAR